MFTVQVWSVRDKWKFPAWGASRKAIVFLTKQMSAIGTCALSFTLPLLPAWKRGRHGGGGSTQLSRRKARHQEWQMKKLQGEGGLFLRPLLQSDLKTLVTRDKLKPCSVKPLGQSLGVQSNPNPPK